jgi:hypothetical protein
VEEDVDVRVDATARTQRAARCTPPLVAPERGRGFSRAHARAMHYARAGVLHPSLAAGDTGPGRAPDPAVGETHGYLDRREDGVFLYAGEGQRGDQELTRGNRAILNHRSGGRTLRVFWGAGGDVKYAGEFVLDPKEPYVWEQAPPTGGGPLRRVVMFRLLPAGLAAAVPRTRRRRESRSTHGSFSTHYHRADEQIAAAPRDPFEVDPNAVDRSLRSHAVTQNALVDVVRQHGLAALSPGPGDPTSILPGATATRSRSPRLRA